MLFEMGIEDGLADKSIWTLATRKLEVLLRYFFLKELFFRGMNSLLMLAHVLEWSIAKLTLNCLPGNSLLFMNMFEVN